MRGRRPSPTIAARASASLEKDVESLEGRKLELLETVEDHHPGVAEEDAAARSETPSWPPVAAVGIDVAELAEAHHRCLEPIVGA